MKIWRGVLVPPLGVDAVLCGSCEHGIIGGNNKMMDECDGNYGMQAERFGCLFIQEAEFYSMGSATAVIPAARCRLIVVGLSGGPMVIAATHFMGLGGTSLRNPDIHIAAMANTIKVSRKYSQQE